MGIDIFELYEDLKKHIGNEYDNAFYDADEGDAQLCILRDMLEKISEQI